MLLVQTVRIPASGIEAFQRYESFELWTHDDDGALNDRLLTTGKATFCAVDEVPELAYAPPPAYLTCGEGLQGISAGWSDTYAAPIPGPELALGALHDGYYALRTAIDPDDRLSESDEDNNTMLQYVRIDGSIIEPVMGPRDHATSFDSGLPSYCLPCCVCIASVRGKSRHLLYYAGKSSPQSS